MDELKPTVLDLFCGAGGLSKGFEQAGFRILAGNDNWKVAVETFRQNHPGAEAISGDVTKKAVQDEIIRLVDRNVDVIVGGPPCQAYSLAGTRNPNDPRGKLFEEYVNIVKAISPNVFVIENVKGILTMKHFSEGISPTEKEDLIPLLREMEGINDRIKGIKKDRSEYRDDDEYMKLKERERSLKMELDKFKEPVTSLIKRRFREIGYAVKWTDPPLNAADFGVPQLRERAFFIGVKDSVKIKFPEATHSEAGHFGKMKWFTMKEAIGDLPPLKERHGDETYEGSFSYIYMSRNRRKEWDEPSFTIQAGARHAPLHPSSPPMRKVGRDEWVFESEEGVRRLSVRECARIQTFPDDFEFRGKVADKYKQIGNAVPPMLARQIAVAVLKMLRDMGRA